MTMISKVRAMLLLTVPAMALGYGIAQSPEGAVAAPAKVLPTTGRQTVGMRRLTEAQYRNSIADIFGPDIQVAGRFEPIVRPAHQLIATGAASASISPAGLEQFDAIARGIAAQVFDDKHRPTFVPCVPKDAGLPDDACARATLAPIGRYLFRRPMRVDEQAMAVLMASAAAKQSGSFYKGLELTLGAMLVSPDFLYIVESAEPDPVRAGQLRLDNDSRASRLSFLLWNTTPNDGLLTAAAEGKLADPAVMIRIATDMVKSPRLAAGTRAFISDMLLFEKFDDIAKDPVIYPRFNQEVARALPEQILRMAVDQLVTRDGDYRELFTTRRTFVNRALGPLYNVPVRSRAGWEVHEFSDGDDRAGLLSQAGFLALYSHSGRSSPTLRGRAIRERLLCQPVPDPPGNVNFAVVQDTTNAVLRTARARLSAHANDPTCAGCHRITDPIGLPLERFDGIGAFRPMENNTAIDVTGTLEGAGFSGAAGLGKALAANPATTQCVAARALEYASGRSSEQIEDMVEALDKDFAADGYRFRALMLRVATLPSLYQIGGISSRPVQSVALTPSGRFSMKGASR